MVAASKRKNSADELKRLFLERSWDVLWDYLAKLGESRVVEATDSRGCAAVVKTLFESITRAQESLGEPQEPDEISIPEIPEEALERAMRICFPEALPKAPAQKPGAARPGVSDRQALGASP